MNGQRDLTVRSAGAYRLVGALLVLATLVAVVVVIVQRGDRPVAAGGDPGSAAAGGAATEDATEGRRGRGGASGPSTPSGEQPNIVLLLTDDQTLAELEAMPKTRRLLGNRGTTFTHAISQYPLCCPARATLLTGQLPHNHGVLGNEEPWGGYGHFDESSTLPIWLQDAGYTTGIVGKYLNGYPVAGEEEHIAPGWDDWSVPVGGIYNYRSFAVNENGAMVRHDEYQSQYTADAVSGLIDRYSRDDAPFFIWSGFLAPHVGGPVEPDDPLAGGDPDAVDTPAVEDRYRDTVVAPDLAGEKESFLEDDLSDKVPWMRRRAPLDAVQVTEHWEQRREALRSVDDAVEQIVSELDATGELDDTVIAFVSDNGFLLGEHGVNQKIFGYEESIRVPMLLAGPGIAEGVTRDQLVGLTDLPATFLDLAGAEPGLTQDGVPLAPMTQDPALNADRPLLLESGGWPFPDEDRLYTGIRYPDGRVLLRWWTGYRETYDLSTDPEQLDGKPDAAERGWRDDAEALLDQLEDCVGTECNVDAGG